MGGKDSKLSYITHDEALKRGKDYICHSDYLTVERKKMSKNLRK